MVLIVKRIHYNMAVLTAHGQHLNYFTITQTLNLMTLPTHAKHSYCATLEPGREEMFSNADMASNK